MIVVRSRKSWVLRIAIPIAAFALAFMAGCWRAQDGGAAARAIAAIQKAEQRAVELDARIGAEAP